MAIPIYAFSGESITRTLIRALDIKEGKWTFVTELRTEPGKDGILIRAISFGIMPFDFRVHNGYVDAAKMNELFILDEAEPKPESPEPKWVNVPEPKAKRKKGRKAK